MSAKYRATRVSETRKKRARRAGLNNPPRRRRKESHPVPTVFLKALTLDGTSEVSVTQSCKVTLDKLRKQ